MTALFFIVPTVTLIASIFIAIRFANKGKNRKRVLALQLLSFVFVSIMCLAGSFASTNSGSVALAAPATTTNQTTESRDNVVVANNEQSSSDKGMAYLGAAIAMGIASIGGGIAVASGSSAAVGAVSEDPKIFGKALIFVALGEGIALYGLLVAILILAKV